MILLRDRRSPLLAMHSVNVSRAPQFAPHPKRVWGLVPRAIHRSSKGLLKGLKKVPFCFCHLQRKKNRLYYISRILESHSSAINDFSFNFLITPGLVWIENFEWNIFLWSWMSSSVLFSRYTLCGQILAFSSFFREVFSAFSRQFTESL